MAIDHLHPILTRVGGLQYHFTTKHHSGGKLSDACWAISEEDEFQVFDDGAFHGIADTDGNVYGVLGDGKGSLRELGTYQEQVAEFPITLPPHAWHGYPCYPLGNAGSEKRRGERARPAKIVFDRLMAAGMIT